MHRVVFRWQQISLTSLEIIVVVLGVVSGHWSPPYVDMVSLLDLLGQVVGVESARGVT